MDDKFYLWRGSVKYAEYTGKTPEDDRKKNWDMLDIGDPLPPLIDWIPPVLTQYLGEGTKLRKPKKIGDAPSSSSLNLISLRAVEALADLWEKHAELYPVILDDHDDLFYMVVCKNKLQWDCLDEEKTVFLKYGIHNSDAGKIYAVKHWEFLKDKVQDYDLLTLPNSLGNIYVSEYFRQRVIAAKLKGFSFFSRAYDTKPFVS